MSASRRTPPPDWRHGGPLPEEAPHRRARKLRDDPEVQGLLEELSQGLKPGEDPLFYEMPEEPDDPDACAPNAAKVYAGPKAPPKAHHQTIEMARVKLAAEVDPRRAVTQRVLVKRPADPKEDAPPMSGPASAGPKSAAGRKRTALVLALGAMAVAFVVLAAIRAPKTKEKPRTSATASAAASTIPNAIPAPTATEAPKATAIPAATGALGAAMSGAPSPVRPGAIPVKPAKNDNPYDAAAGPLTAAPVEPPPPPPPPAPTKQLVEDKPVY